MENISEISAIIFDALNEAGKEEVCASDLIEHIILLFIEFKEDYEKNIFDKTDHPDLYPDGEDIEINEYIKFIEKELHKDNISIDIELLTKIIYLIREYDDESD